MVSGSVRRDETGLAGLAARIDAGLPAWMTVRTIFIGLLLVSLCVDLGFGFLYKFRPSPLKLEADEFEYYRIATRLMDGSFVLTARRTLAYPLVIVGIRSISDSFLVLQALITAVFSFSAPLLFLVVRRVTGSIRAGALSGLVLALWPPVLFYAVSLYSEALALPVFLLALWVLPPGSRTGRPLARRDWIQAVGAGVLLAAATQVRPMYLIMTPFIVLIMLFEERDLRRALSRIVLVAAAFTVTTLPWSAYMTARFHHPILVTSNGGETMAGGLTPKLLDPDKMAQMKTRGRDAWVGPGKWLTVAQNGYLTPAEQTLPYDQQDALLKARAVAWVKANPWAAARLESAKLLYMWGFYPLSRNSWGQIVLGSVPTIVLLAFALYCLATMRTARTALARFWILPVFVSAVAAISWGSWRFRQPGDVGLIAFCVVCLLIRQATRRAPDGRTVP